MYDEKYKNDYIVHYNHNHDALGRFARSNTGSVRKAEKVINKDRKKANKNLRKHDRKYNRRGVVDSPQSLDKDVKKGRKTDNREKVNEEWRKNWKKNKELKSKFKDYEKASIEASNHDWDPKYVKKADAKWEIYKKAEIREAKKYASKYAQATIKDLNLDNTKEVENFIVNRLDDNYINYWEDTTRLKKKQSEI